MSYKNTIMLLNRAAAALETPGDLEEGDVQFLIEDLLCKVADLERLRELEQGL